MREEWCEVSALGYNAFSLDMQFLFESLFLDFPSDCSPSYFPIAPGATVTASMRNNICVLTANVPCVSVNENTTDIVGLIVELSNPTKTSIPPSLNIKCPTKTISYNFSSNWDFDPIYSDGFPAIKFTPKANSTGTLSLGVSTDSNGINMTNIEKQNGNFYMRTAKSAVRKEILPSRQRGLKDFKDCDVNSNLMTVFDGFELGGCGV